LVCNMKMHLKSLSKKIISLVFLFFSFFVPSLVFAQENPIGTIDKPEVIKAFDAKGNVGEDQIGILNFMSTMITYITVLAGIWTFVNLMIAVYTYITSSGNSQTHIKVRDRLTMSILGMILIVTVYAVAGILGTVFFGNSLYLLNPTITGPGTP